MSRPGRRGATSDGRTDARTSSTRSTADDAARVAELVAADPALATPATAAGVSALMLSRYRFDRAATDALLAVDPDLDVFEATALGYIDRLRERLEEDPGGRGPTRPMASRRSISPGSSASRRRRETLLEAGAEVNAYSTQRVAGPAAPQRGGRAPHRGLPGADRGRRRRERHADGTGSRRSTRRRSTATSSWSSCSCRPGRIRGRDRRWRHAADIATGGHVDVARRLREVAAERRAEASRSQDAIAHVERGIRRRLGPSEVRHAGHRVARLGRVTGPGRQPRSR